jgi:uncharacterized BrkB/YihY/UPF0761 family membrane protein
MKKKTKNDWEPWQQKLVLFICTLGLFILVILDYGDYITGENTSSTKGRIFHDFLQNLDLKFGKEYVIGLLFIILIISGTSTIFSYKKKKKKEKE